jgi:hypothetical protein
VVTDCGQVPAQSPGAATGIEDPGAAGRHCVYQASLAGQILTGAGHRAEALDIPTRMAGIGSDLLHPNAPLDHASIIAAYRKGGLPCSS